jgi:hypothetical protein
LHVAPAQASLHSTTLHGIACYACNAVQRGNDATTARHEAVLIPPAGDLAWSPSRILCCLLSRAMFARRYDVTNPRRREELRRY